MKKLEVGAGNMRVRKGSIAVDVYTPKWAVEVPERFILCNVEKDELPFGDGEFDEVVLKHVFEHFGTTERRRVIEKCLRCLRTGGFLRIIVPNTERYIERYRDGLWSMEELSAMLFGAQEEEWRSECAHKVCYSQDSLRRFILGDFTKDLEMVNMETGYRGRWKDPRMEIRAMFRKKGRVSEGDSGE